MKDILKYINPLCKTREPITLYNICYFSGYLLLCYGINLLLYYFASYLIELDIVGIENYKNHQMGFPLETKIFIISVFLVPITEEILFRLGLVFSPIKASFLITGLFTSIPYLAIRPIIKSNTYGAIVYFSVLVFLFLLFIFIFDINKSTNIFFAKKY